MAQSDAEEAAALETARNTSTVETSGTASAQPAPRWLHGSSIIFLFVGRVRNYLIPAIVATVAAAAGSQFFVIVLAISFLATLAVDTVRLFTLQYYLANDELVVRQGLLFRQQRTIPLSRIQNIDLLQNPLHRLFGVAEVRVETASGSEPEATLRVLSLDDVARLKHQLSVGVSPAAVQSSTENAEEDSTQRELLKVSIRDLVTLGLISNRGAVLVAIAVGALHEFDVYERLDWGRAEEAARAMWRANLQNAVIAGLLLFAGALLVLRLLSIVWCLLRFYGYRLTADEEDLRVSAGLFTKVSATVPRRRIQFVSIHRSLLARWIGRASIRIETAGGGAQANEDARATIARRWFVPIIAEKKLAPLIGELPWTELE